MQNKNSRYGNNFSNLSEHVGLSTGQAADVKPDRLLESSPLVVRSSVVKRFESLLERTERVVSALQPSLPAESGSLFDLWIAFRWQRDGRVGNLVPVRHPHLVNIDELVGIDGPRDQLLRNTEQFVAGFPANNILLWGERGTGKSSCVKGLLKPFASRGLRLIEVERTDLTSIPALLTCSAGMIGASLSSVTIFLLPKGMHRIRS